MSVLESVGLDIDTWYHGSPAVLTELAAGSTITGWKALAAVFSHKPSTVSYDTVGGYISHNGLLDGYLYIVDEPIIRDADIYRHPSSSMDEDVEWLTRRPLRLKLIQHMECPTLEQSIKMMTGEIVSILADNTPSVYFFGSAALDDFKLGWSNID